MALVNVTNATYGDLGQYGYVTSDGKTSTPDLHLFGFQSAILPMVSYPRMETSAISNPFYLFLEGCDQSGGQNCTSSCRDVGTAFGSLDTLHNCIAYPAVAQLWVNGNLSASDIDLAIGLGIQKEGRGSDLISNITDTLQGCLSSYCDKVSGCAQDSQSSRFNETIFNSPNAYFYYMTDDGYIVGVDSEKGIAEYGAGGYYYQGSSPSPDICSLQPAGLNADIGGIGVYVSYWVQSGLALLGAIAVLWWGWGMYYFCLVVCSPRYGVKSARDIAQRIGNKWANHRLPCVISALTDFQKAQCFFMLAINIAAQVNRGRGGFQPTSLQQLYNNYVLIKVISFGGYLPITFTLLTLHLVDMVSWYLMLLSIFTVAISTATLVVIGTFAPSQADLDFLSNQALTGGPEKCGGRNMLVYCLRPVGSYNIIGATSNDPTSGAFSMLGFCLVVLVLLVIDQFQVFRRLSVMQNKPWLSRTQIFVIGNFLNIRGLQLLLATVSIALAGMSVYNPFLISVSFITIICLLYIFVTSDMSYHPRHTRAGRAFKRGVVLAIDLVAVLFNFTNMIYYSLFGAGEPAIAGPTVCLMIVLWLTFSATTIMSIVHVHRAREARLDAGKPSRQYPIIIRRMIGMVSSGWRVFSSIFLDTKFQSLRSNASRFKRNMKSSSATEDWAARLAKLTVFSLYALFFAIYIYWFTVFATGLYWFTGMVDPHTWSFGQVVAITVWAQPVCEYIHLELRGMSRGFQHRLMWPYKVISQEVDEERGYDAAASSSSSKAQDEVAEGRGSYEMLSRPRASTSASQADPTMEVSKETRHSIPRKEVNRRSSSVFNSSIEEARHEGWQASEEINSPATSAEEKDISHEQWQIPESVLLTSDTLDISDDFDTVRI